MSGRIAILMGNEANGLSEFWLNDANTTKVKIPMAGDADSLNISAAAAITVFEAVRQRS